MTSPVSHRVYDFYGRFYDGFEGLFKRRLEATLAAAPFRPGDRILDVGIGTGLSLNYYPPFVHITGIDLSPKMLRQAQRKLDLGIVRKDAHPADTLLMQADALRLPFADGSFDHCFLSHVISTVSDPQKCLAEAARVIRDEGHIIMINHFRSRLVLMAWLESMIDPLCRPLGWRCDLSLQQLFQALNVQDADHTKCIRGVLFQVVYLRKHLGRLRLVPAPEPAPRVRVRLSLDKGPS